MYEYILLYFYLNFYNTHSLSLFHSRSREMEDRSIEIDVPSKGNETKLTNVTFDQSPSGIMTGTDMKQIFASLSKKRSEKKKMSVRDARMVFEEVESEKILESYDIFKEAIAAVEESGIVFIDEIDKLVSSGLFTEKFLSLFSLSHVYI